MIYIFYNNDPLGDDQGGGVSHLRGLYRQMLNSNVEFKVIGCKYQNSKTADNVEYVANTSNFLAFFFGLTKWFWKNRKVLHNDDVFHFHRNYAAWPKFLVLGTKGKVFITYHGITGYYLQKKLGFLAAPIRQLMIQFEKKSVKLSNGIIFVSETVRQGLKGRILNGDLSKTHVLPANIDTAAFNGALPPNQDVAKKLLVIARLSYIKNLPLAIDIASKLKDKGYTLDIAGDGDETENIKSYIEKSGLSETVRLLGRVSNDNLPKLLEEHGIVLLTSLSEASPTVVKEAIAAQRPIVTVEVGDVKLWVRDGQNGFICEPNVDSCANGVLKANQLIESQQYDRGIELDVLSEKQVVKQLLEIYTCD